MTGSLLTAREVAERFSVSTETILRWVRRGKLPAIRLPGGAIRFREDAIDRLLDEWATSRNRQTPPIRAEIPPTYGAKV
jgi:excisionase family DNA binding protein